MYKKNLIRSIIVSVTATLTLFFASSIVIAGPCADQPVSEIVTCWDFEQYRVSLVEVTPGNETWTYAIQRISQTKPSDNNNSINLLFMIGAKVIINENLTSADIFPPPDGDPATNVGVGDSFRQTVKYTIPKTGTSEVDLSIQPTGVFATNGSIYIVDDNNKYELGSMMVPGTANEISATFVIDQSAAGGALATVYDFSRESYIYWRCTTGNCDYTTFPDNFTPVTENDLINLNEVIICLPPDDETRHNGLLPNSELKDLEGKSIAYCHYGIQEHADEDSRIQLSNRTVCKYVYGKYTCYVVP